MNRDDWFNYWVPGVMLDDQLWYQALLVDRVLEMCQAMDQSEGDEMIWKLLHRGTRDLDSEDKPWDSSTQSMQYLVALGCHLWAMIGSKRTRVSPHASFQVCQNNHVDREIAWSVR